MVVRTRRAADPLLSSVVRAKPLGHHLHARLPGRRDLCLGGAGRDVQMRVPVHSRPFLGREDTGPVAGDVGGDAGRALADDVGLAEQP